jgi:formate dehydrogenase subunit beta
MVIMNVNRVLELEQSDPVHSFQEFLTGLWGAYELEALLAPAEIPDPNLIGTRMIHDPSGLTAVNPFAPVMLSNAARTADLLIQEHPSLRVAVILRPCELRVYTELRKRRTTPVDDSQVVIIGIDCLGTFLPDNYRQMVEQRGAALILSETMLNASEGGLRPQPFRTACQICDWPAPRGADLVMGTIGVDSNQHLLLIARDEDTDQRLGLPGLADHLATEYQVSHRETVVGALADMRAVIRKNMVEELATSRHFGDLGSVLAWLNNCDLCGKCLNACPLYDGELDNLLGKSKPRHPERAPLADLVAVSRWLSSCGGCGMCEETCAQGVPLILLISALSHRIQGDLHYASGDASKRLPWMPDHAQ